MKKLLSLLFTLGLTLSACGTAQTQVAPLAQTSTPTLTPTITQTPTATITPLPTIPTFTPTFDVRTIVTVMPAEKAECLKENSQNDLSIEFATFPSGKKYIGHPTVEVILRSLNSGTSTKKLTTELEKIGSEFTFQDVTDDGVSDLVIVSGLVSQIINILYCDKGKYKLFPKNDIESEPLVNDNVQFMIRDLNQNGTPDIISVGHGNTGLEINVIEWNGEIFNNLTDLGAWMPGAGMNDFRFVDLDRNNVPEIVLEGKPNEWYYPGEPLRGKIDVYQWNGEEFLPLRGYSPPEYRFQAIQDGDRFTNQGNFTQARLSYEEAIQSSSLNWWSKERFETNRDAILNSSTPPVLIPGPAEYPSLASYAYYRIILLQLVQGQESEAASTYQTLQQTFGSDSYGSPYVEMATVFWDAYQSTHKMYDGCASAIQYAVEHPELLTPLGSDYHGSQSHKYVPADVCPFR